MKHKTVILLLLVLLSLAVFDFELWKTDPSGVVTYLWSYYDLQQHALPAPDGLRYAPGNYRFSRYDVTIGLDGFRAVIGNRGGACRIVFIGDSTTFGMSADRSYVDDLAPDIQATVINAGIPGYNIGNIAKLVQDTPADGYVWLVFPNDAQPPLAWRVPDAPPPALILYRDLYLTPQPVPQDDAAMFRQLAAPLLQRDNVLAFAFEGARLTDIVQDYGAVVISWYTSTVSRYDGHADDAGNAQVADSMRAKGIEFTGRICHGHDANS